MDSNSPIMKLDVNPRILSEATRVGVRSLNDVLSISSAELQRRTTLSNADVQALRTACASAIYGSTSQTALQLLKKQQPRLSMGCKTLDTVLRGGILSSGITELVGQSATGKTQFCLQLSIMVQLPLEQGGLAGSVVYVSTEHAFPDQRLQQMIPYFRRKYPQLNKDPGSGIFLQKSDSIEELWHVIAHKIPKAIELNSNIRLVIIDSIAALFRAEQESVSSRAQRVGMFGQRLKELSDSNRVPIVCTNQVSDYISESFEGASKMIIPALGLTWSNTVNTRILLQRKEAEASVSRNLHIVLASHLPNARVGFTVTDEGVRGVDSSS